MAPSSPIVEPTWKTVIRLMRWDKPTGRLILMIPALWSLFLAAAGKPDVLLLVVIICGSLATSAGGCVVNDLWDRNIDPKVDRTRNRPLASRALTIKTGIVIATVAFLCAIGFALYLNPLSILLCFLASPVIVFYPLAKRVFPVPQLVLAIAWGFAVLIPWSAVTGSLAMATWLLWGATVLWTLGFDTVYAIPDRKYDAQLGVKSSARFFGSSTPEVVGLLFMGTGILLLWLGVYEALGVPYIIAWAIACGVWFTHYRKLRHRRQPAHVYGQIFRQNVMLGFVLLGGMIAGSLMG
ncbi:4-hydroxybenzoate solanesyltransferase [Leptolyngbya cf. ectocarpi LEGE 11479]|uniref:4-hydroxybenzoate solanesyltransferase n=1 Tax=Leptolyngbya cf. ectocarpi LEGE 11479 TaxID=1828722 RepID=A0A928ZW13_LEPEC|nr:4-hydroxybenzoate solanesyltransferase [Leptolyngbya ectocarpi]MBE9068415.1 4-hydroxybenzoate solanesyltransferase [Leptolyngbya cf. ectocarpi LEGE 11479]